MSGQKRKNILVVDSDPYYCCLMALSLVRAGYEAIQAESIEKARFLLKKLPDLDLIVLDVSISGISAIQIQQEFRQNGEGIPVFTVADTLDKTFVIDLLQNGHSEYIEKYMKIQSGYFPASGEQINL